MKSISLLFFCALFSITLNAQLTKIHNGTEPQSDGILNVGKIDPNTNTAQTVLMIQRNSSATPGAGIGGSILFKNQMSNGSIRKSAAISGISTNALGAPFDQHGLKFDAYQNGAIAKSMFLNQTGLGIGIDIPTRLLHLEGGSTSTGLLYSKVNYIGSNDVIAIHGHSITQAGWGIGGEFTGGYKGLNVIGSGQSSTGTSYGIYTQATGTAGVRIGLYANATGGTTNWSMYSQGNSYFGGDVRIGTQADPDGGVYKLIVDGKIIAEEMRIQNSSTWPDYVFEKNYDLMPLGELEKMIQENHHLPGIPSACEVEENGIEVGDMQKRMMEKIEELTLYVIQQQKEIDQLKVELKKVKE